MHFDMEKGRLPKKVRRTINDAQRPPQPLMHLTAEILRIGPDQQTRSYDENGNKYKRTSGIEVKEVAHMA